MPLQASAKVLCSVFKEVGVGTGANKADVVAFQSIDQQEITADMAFTVVCPVAFELVVQPFGSEWCIVGYQQQHEVFQTIEVVPAGAGKAFPVLDKSLGVIKSSR